MVHALQVRVFEDTFDVQSFVLVLLEASVNEILQLWRPPVGVNLSMVIFLNRFVKLVVLLSRKGRISGCEFKSIAPVTPDVDFFGVGFSSHDFRADPIWSASSSLSLRGSVGEESAETQVSDTDFTLRIAQNVITLDISM